MSSDAKRLLKLAKNDIDRNRDIYVAVGGVGHE